MYKSVNLVVLCLSIAMFFLGSASVTAQVQEPAWSPPYRLSGRMGRFAENSNATAADDYGYAHVFWIEELGGARSVIMHTRFDGETWDVPIDLHVVSAQAASPSPFVDPEGTIHLVWVEGNHGPAYYSTAPAHRANSAAEWSRPLRIDVPAHDLDLRVTPDGTLHLVYTDLSEDRPGIYYTRSTDGALTWSSPIWLDPDIPRDHQPQHLQFLLDNGGGLHVVWQTFNLSQSTGGALRYIRSPDGGRTWAEPVIIDEPDESEGELRAADPVLVLQDRTVHVIWAGDETTHREHRYSMDAGETWTSVTPIFGDLHGQAGDDCGVDATGRVHFIGQIRYPQGLYHAFWDAQRWSSPDLFYEINLDSSNPLEGQIHAHNVQVAVQAGHQLVATFYDRSDTGLYVLYAMDRTLEGVPAIQPHATPTPASVEATPTVIQSTPTVHLTVPNESIPSSQNQSRIGQGTDNIIWFSLGPTLLLLIIVGVAKLRGGTR